MIFDCHCHTHNSKDSLSAVEEICQAAIAAGYRGIAFTDHCDLELVKEWDIFAPIANSVAEAEAMQKAFAGRLQVFTGVELCEFVYDPSAAEKALHLADYDVVLGSIHAARYGRIVEPTSYIDFTNFTKEDIDGYLQAYFADMYETLQTYPINVLCHPTVPLRYICEKYGHKVDMTRYWDKIEEILALMIEKGVALECNTGRLNPKTVWYCPDLEIFARYYAMGGRRITLGSDAHTPQQVGRHMAWAVEQLKKIGFQQACYFKNRKPVFYDL